VAVELPDWPGGNGSGPDDPASSTMDGVAIAAAAAIAAKPVETPLMSTAEVITVIVPSLSTRHSAAAGSVPPGQ